jgi:hypothetical protein
MSCKINNNDDVKKGERQGGGMRLTQLTCVCITPPDVPRGSHNETRANKSSNTTATKTSTKQAEAQNTNTAATPQQNNTKIQCDYG